MTVRERINQTLSFEKPNTRGAAIETFYPWGITVREWGKQGLPYVLSHLYDNQKKTSYKRKPEEEYLDCIITDKVMEFENFFGFDGVARIFLKPPFRNYDGEKKRPYIKKFDEWKKLESRAIRNIENYYTEKNIEKIYGKYLKGAKAGEYSVWLSAEGFFWGPRELFGIKEHLTAFYDMPEIMHEINIFLAEFYLNILMRITDCLPVDLVYFTEDLSGKNGPMISPKHFDEFVGQFYKKIIHDLRKNGVKHIFMDTDGDFSELIPNILSCGIDGFLPMDVNSGMDICEVRAKFPDIKLIGGFNKMVIGKGKDAIDMEFKRILPVIRQGGYLPGNDHQVPPTAPLENYRYYIKRVFENMEQSGADLP